MPHKDPEARKAYRRANKDKWRAGHKRWRDKNREHWNCRSRAWVEANPERRKEIVNNWDRANKTKRAVKEQRRRARKKNSVGQFTSADVDELFVTQRGNCLCGQDLRGNFHIDHMTPLSRGGSNGPENIQLLCPPCNLSKNARTMSEWTPTKKDIDMSDVKTPEATIMFSKDLFELNERDNGSKNYGCTLAFKKGTDLSELQNAAVASARETWPGKPVEEWIKEGTIKNPFLDGDGKQGKDGDGNPKPGYAGTTFIRCTSGEKYKPKVYDRQRLPVYEVADCPSGSKVFAVVNPYAWDNPKNGKGISFGVSLVQVVRKAIGEEVLGGGGGPNPDKFFEALPDEGAAPDSTKGGAGAAGLFS